MGTFGGSRAAREGDAREPVVPQVSPPEKIDEAVAPADSQLKTAQQSALLQAYKAAKGALQTFCPPLSLSELIGSDGKSLRSLPLPNGEKIGAQVTLGLPAPSSSHALTAIEYDHQEKGFWLTISCKDKNKNATERKVLLLEEKRGKEAVKQLQDLQVRDLNNAYQDARSEPQTFNPPLSLAELIASNGQSQMVLPLPNGEQIGAHVALGLPRPSSDHVLTALQYDHKEKGFWLTIYCKDRNNNPIERKVLILEDQSGKEAVKQLKDLQVRDLNNAYLDARSGPQTFHPPLGLSELIGSDGKSQMVFLLPNEEKIGPNVGLGLPAHSSKPALKSLTYLGGDKFLATLVAKNNLGSSRESVIVIGNNGIERLKDHPNDESLIAKGYALDRYLAYLMARSGAVGHTNYRFKGVALIDEAFKPNIFRRSPPPAVVHAKWGNRGNEVLDYMLKYVRLSRIHGIKELEMVVAVDKYEEEFKKICSTLNQELGVTTSVNDIRKFGAALGIRQEEIDNEILVLDALCGINDVEGLKAKSYQPILPSSESHSLESSTSTISNPDNNWQERLKQLATPVNYEQLATQLQEAKRVHSPYWERDYHFTLIEHLSYLTDEILPANRQLDDTQKDSIRELVRSIYPEILEYPGLWKTIRVEVATQSTSLKGDSTEDPPVLERFDLKIELAKNHSRLPRGAANKPASQDPINLKPVDQERDALLELITSTDNPLALVTRLKPHTEELRKHGLIDLARTEVITRFVQAIFRTPNQTDQMPAALLEVKSSHSREDDLIRAIQSLGETQISLTLSNNKKTKLSAQSILENIRWLYRAEP